MNRLEQIESRLDHTSHTVITNLFEVNLEIKKRVYELTADCRDVPFGEIYKLPLGEPIKLPSAACGSCDHKDTDDCDLTIHSIMQSKTPDKVEALVNFSPGVALAKHYHNDINEEINVINDDKVIVFETNGEIKTHVLEFGDTLFISAGRVHQIISMFGKTLSVIFHKV